MTKAAAQSVMDHVRIHCEEAYPDECCGVVVGLADGSTKAMRIRNIQNQMHAENPEMYPRTARIAYTGHPQDLRAALEAADEPGASLLAFYHSHPDHDAYFSAEDTAQATPFGEPSYPDALQIVVSVRHRRSEVAKAFAWSPAESAYVEVPLEQIFSRAPAS